MKRILLAYSGSLAGSAAIPWLAQHNGAEVVTLTLDFGQDRELAAVRSQALALGAIRAHVIDVREEFVRNYLLPTLQAGALSDGYALARPLIAKRLVDVARMESAAAVAHAAQPESDAGIALAREIASLGGGVLAPMLDVRLAGDDPGALARARGVHVAPVGRYRVDATAWGRRITPIVEGPLPEDAFTLTRAPEEGPDQPALIEVEFVAGVPVRTNGVELSITELIESLETIAGAHGVGRRVASDAAVESPAATVLAIAHRELEARSLGDDVAGFKAQLSRTYADALLSGRWFSDLREGIDAFVRLVQPRVTGTVTLRLLKGQCTVTACAPARPARPDSSAPAARTVVA